MADVSSEFSLYAHMQHIGRKRGLTECDRALFEVKLIVVAHREAVVDHRHRVGRRVEIAKPLARPGVLPLVDVGRQAVRMGRREAVDVSSGGCR
jgi:hypothetical protein